jgi:hypothetical protein
MLLVCLFTNLYFLSIFQSVFFCLKKNRLASCQWLTPVILADWEDCGSRTAQANSLRLISKLTRAKWSWGVTQVVEYLLCKCKPWVQNPVSPKKLKFTVKVCALPRQLLHTLVAMTPCRPHQTVWAAPHRFTWVHCRMFTWQQIT